MARVTPVVVYQRPYRQLLAGTGRETLRELQHHLRLKIGSSGSERCEKEDASTQDEGKGMAAILRINV